MIALWVVLAVVVVGLALTATLTTRTRRRRPVTEPAPGPRLPPTTEAPEASGAPEVEELAALEGVAALEEVAALEAEVETAPEAEVEAELGEGERRPGLVEAPAEAPSFRARLGRTRGLFSGLRSLRGRGALEGATWDDLEEALLRADVGVATTEALLEDLRRRVASKEIAGGDELLGALRADLVDLLDIEARWDGATDAELADGRAAPGDDHEVVAPVGRSLRFDGEPGVVNVWLLVGVNGVGKTTTVGKLARREAAAGRSVLLAAGDTFRAAAGEQLSLWAARTGAEIVRGAEGGDPSAVVFDAVQRAAARGNDLVLADTAGRLHTKVNLVEELKKIRRVADRPPGRVTEVLLVLDATTGQNGLVQAREFTEAVACTGVVLTKLDGTAKGGVVIAVQRELALPVKLVGLGEGPDDLVPFDPAAFVDALLS
ncbi:MAG: signal recognition particle-docking protein FtsY [Acidimicrobiales bacterium]